MTFWFSVLIGVLWAGGSMAGVPLSGLPEKKEWSQCSVRADCVLAFDPCRYEVAVRADAKKNYEKWVKASFWHCPSSDHFCGCSELCGEWRKDSNSHLACVKGECRFQWPSSDLKKKKCESTEAILKRLGG